MIFRRRANSWIAGCLVATSICASPSLAEDQRQSTVGMPARIDQLVLPGSELQAKPLERGGTPVVIRVAAAFPHGTAFRYDIVYYGLEPGQFDLKDYLQRKDRSSVDDLPSIPVQIKAVLPPGQVVPHTLAARPSPYLGGYWTAISIAGLVWVVGLVAILWWIGADRLRAHGGLTAAGQPLSLADRLRPIVQDAIAGRISEARLAELERMLLAFWRRRLKLDDLNAADALAALRQHPEAGALLERLEIWLHRPGYTDEVDVAALLQPYRDLPADALEGGR